MNNSSNIFKKYNERIAEISTVSGEMDFSAEINKEYMNGSLTREQYETLSDRLHKYSKIALMEAAVTA